MEPAIRASDAEREQTIGVLQQALSVGRLTLDEFDERCAAAVSAHTRGDLAVLTRDLPGTPERPGAPKPSVDSGRLLWTIAASAAVVLVVLALSLAVLPALATAAHAGGMMAGCH